jgi:hypothetical protein
MPSGPSEVDQAASLKAMSNGAAFGCAASPRRSSTCAVPVSTRVTGRVSGQGRRRWKCQPSTPNVGISASDSRTLQVESDGGNALSEFSSEPQSASCTCGSGGRRKRPHSPLLVTAICSKRGCAKYSRCVPMS